LDNLGPGLALMNSRANSVRIWMRKVTAPGGVTGIVMALVFVVATNTFLLAMRSIQELPPVALTYLIPVVIAALRWGTASATVTAVGGTATLTYFFYGPFHSFGSADRSRVLGIVFFMLVSLVLGYLAARTRHDAARAVKRENEILDLYAFSQRIAAANSPADIFEAMQRHLAMLVGRKVLLFDPMGMVDARCERLDDDKIPSAVIEGVTKGSTAADADPSRGIIVDDGHSIWLVRPVSAHAKEFGVIAVALGQRSDLLDDLRARVVAVINDAAQSLERLGLARIISEARMRTESERFREALIGSVSHELRTPLASILGASTVLSMAPKVTEDAQLRKLAELIHQESERLNAEIQNVIDASRISGNGLQAKLEWAEPADVVNAALRRCCNRLVGRSVEVTLPEELILLHIDLVLMERALGQILDNSAKYSPAESSIVVRGQLLEDHFVLSVSDYGAGLDADDRASLGQKFFRGTRHAQVTPGLGLGFWIASAFTTANNGTIDAVSDGVDRGMTVTIRLPLEMTKAEGS
jgi:two-component system sensor histidine kinase KdpD